MILALALGNPIRGDDGAGAAIARALLRVLPGLEVIESLEILPEHADAVAGAERVVFLDAAARGAPGEVRVFPLAPREAREPLLHALAPEDVLGLARLLHGRAPPAALVTIAGRDFSFGEKLSPEVAAALEEARDRAAAFLRGP